MRVAELATGWILPSTKAEGRVLTGESIYRMIGSQLVL